MNEANGNHHSSPPSGSGAPPFEPLPNVYIGDQVLPSIEAESWRFSPVPLVNGFHNLPPQWQPLAWGSPTQPATSLPPGSLPEELPEHVPQANGLPAAPQASTPSWHTSQLFGSPAGNPQSMPSGAQSSSLVDVNSEPPRDDLLEVQQLMESLGGQPQPHHYKVLARRLKEAAKWALDNSLNGLLDQSEQQKIREYLVHPMSKNADDLGELFNSEEYNMETVKDIARMPSRREILDFQVQLSEALKYFAIMRARFEVGQQVVGNEDELTELLIFARLIIPRVGRHRVHELIQQGFADPSGFPIF